MLEGSAAIHAERGLELAFTGEYAGAHWLSSFATYLLTRNEGGHRAGVRSRSAFASTFVSLVEQTFDGPLPP